MLSGFRIHYSMTWSMFVMLTTEKIVPNTLPLLAGLVPGWLAGWMAGLPRYKLAGRHENSYSFTQERLGENVLLSC